MTDPLPQDRRLPLADRLSPEHPDYRRIVAAHDAALRRGDPGYVDPGTGYLVFTAGELWDRGACCGSGCRHCPYEDGPRGTAGGQSRPGTE